MEPFVIDEIHTSHGWRLHSPSLKGPVYVTERSDANEVVALLNRGIEACAVPDESPAAVAPDASDEKPSEPVPATEGDTE